MKEEALREKIIETYWKFWNGSLPPDQFADEIIALTEKYYREAGWKSPEEVKQFIRQMCDTCLPEPNKDQP